MTAPQLLFVTQNKNKVLEIEQLFAESLYEIIGLNELGFEGEIPETQNTIKGNALQKAEFIYEKYGINCFADDTGLEIEALNDEPGVYSARYAGEPVDSEKNIEKVLKNLEGKTNRNAQFKTVIALILEGEKYFFKGIVKGKIIHRKAGNAGFGYDPIFLPDGFKQTFSEMNAELKNEISHRGIAIRKLINYLI